MKRTVTLLVISYLLYSGPGCIKDTSCTPKTVQEEQMTIVNYALSNGINATAHSSGLYYEIINAGSGTTPTAGSTVSVTYTGKLLNGTIFDSKSTPIQLSLPQTITGWQYGLPLIAEGGVIKLIIPSSLAFGCTGTGAIPADAVLYFEITLVDVL
jgi:FKBP-type peptidyl-prolyl cis-trans isomerase FkpA